ncbi:MAG: IS30 family transposase [Brachymonas sp.]|nr:IS30 family transposase [Brachymonas sp.]NJS35997.1 IS30 family transposase [Brachymonas sp.]
MNYTQLSLNERYQISALLQAGQSRTTIAKQLQRHRSTIDREIARCGCTGLYDAAIAHSHAMSCQQASRNAKPIAPHVLAHVDCYLRLSLSPQQVCGRLDAEGIAAPSVEGIYQHILKDQAACGDLYTYLRCQKARRKRYASGRERRGQIAGRVCIEQRPAIVDKRRRIGDWEGDTVVGSHHKGFLVTLVERKSRYCLVAQVPNKEATRVGEAIIEMLRPHKQVCHTITFDNGKEFAQHQYVADCLEAKVYFAHPYCSWERGLNENTNGLLRQYFPKGTNLQDISQEQVDEAVYALNHRPRKCLGYKTPHEVFYGLKLTPIKLPTDALRS